MKDIFVLPVIQLSAGGGSCEAEKSRCLPAAGGVLWSGFQ